MCECECVCVCVCVCVKEERKRRERGEKESEANGVTEQFATSEVQQRRQRPKEKAERTSQPRDAYSYAPTANVCRG